MTPAQIMQVQFRFVDRLKDHGVTVYFHTLHDIPMRWESIRTAIVDYGFAQKPMRKESDETYSAAFERATGTPLVPAEAAA
jgi:hypothetical protein